MLLPVVFYLMLAPANHASAQASLPDGFRYPTDADRALDWEAFKVEEPTPFHAEADFDGDGVLDHAWILLRTSGKGWGLFVFHGHGGDPPVIEALETDDGQAAAQHFGIAVAKPGKYKTACGKGYWPCKPGEPSQVKLGLPAIDFHAFESASSLFWWDKATKRFVRTWMSD